MVSLLVCPRLVAKISVYPEQIILSQGDRVFAVANNDNSSAILQQLFLMMDGTNSWQFLQQKFFPQNPDLLDKIVLDLDERGFIDDVDLPNSNGIDTVLELKELSRELLAKNNAQHTFWQKVAAADSDRAIKIISGMAIEQYHLLTNQCYFNSAILGFSSSIAIRELLNERYCDRYKQTEILLEALNAIGINAEDARNIVPLPQTTAICHALTYCANFEPMFFLTTIETLEKQIIESFLSCWKLGKQLNLSSSFLQPIEKFTSCAIAQDVENLTEDIFQHFPRIDSVTKARLRGKTILFWEMYDNFYKGVWNGYTSATNLCRRIETI